MTERERFIAVLTALLIKGDPRSRPSVSEYGYSIPARPFIEYAKEAKEIVDLACSLE